MLTLIGFGRIMRDTWHIEITPEQFSIIEHCFPRQRGNVSLSNLNVLNAILYVTEHGCKWRGLPERFDNWHTLYTRMSRWSKAHVLDRVFAQLQQSHIVRIKIEAAGDRHDKVPLMPRGTEKITGVHSMP